MSDKTCSICALMKCRCDPTTKEMAIQELSQLERERDTVHKKLANLVLVVSLIASESTDKRARATAKQALSQLKE